VHRDTLLPTDCAQVLPDGMVAALLAQPVDTLTSHTVLGMSSPAVGMLERLDCSYRRRGDSTTATLQLRAQAYTDPDAATAHWKINVGAESASAHATANIAIGTAPAVVLSEPGRTVLMVTNDRENVTLSLFDAVVPGMTTPDLLVDLARRVLPALAPEPAAPPPASARPPNPPSSPHPGDATAVRVGTHK
jgi:hypothetical protein